MTSAPQEVWTPQSYLNFERESAEKHEYLDGDIYLMAGASANHNLIVGNLYASLHAQLRQRPCVVYPSDMRLKIRETDLYTYPDISVVCDAPRFEDAQRDTLLNPTVIIEVLSPSTESYDRGKKFQHYRTLDSLQEYILVAQDSPRIERYLRQPDGQWLFADATQMDGRLELPSISCTLLLSDVYEKVTFERDPK
ncbi:MAG: Uma2 family endonuclease [Anaerolineae bacterium]|nr:Uma2 family endonuclease [Anaerolineae bacterium]